MPIVCLPDGSKREYANAVTLAEVAQSIGPSLAKAALAGRVNDRLYDLSHLIQNDVSLSIITAKDQEGLELLRHSAAHLLAHAVKQLYPTAQVTIGPVIDNGFYYDFAYERPFTPDDLTAIEAKMLELSNQDEQVAREEWDRDHAVEFFKSQGELYKAQIIASIPSNEKISLYRQGDFIDLCRGPHVPSTGKLKFFKLTKVAGAYWRGDSNNEMLQRVYGTAWATKDELKDYLHRLEEAEKRDHRKLGKQLDLFHMQDTAPGLAFWHPKGWAIWQQVEQYMRQIYKEGDYQEIRCPQILDRKLWEKSGHWENYKDNMFTTESEKRDYALKPMNCPGHVEVFKSKLHSYRELPVRYGEFGGCHRNEPSGALHGLMRVRGFTQDDGHIFCTEAQVCQEVVRFNEIALRVYQDFGFEKVAVKLALRPSSRLGSDETWDRAENALREALTHCGVTWEELPGEGAFYGPKIEYHLNDSIGRSWQCGTIQVDFQLPGRLGAEYVSENNTREVPVMLHRAILGSLERFIGILIENHAGSMPVWLAPVQVVLLNISEKQSEYTQQVAKLLKSQGYRVETDLRNEKINRKIREHTLLKVPYIAVIGDSEVERQMVSVRERGNKDLGTLTLESFANLLHANATSKV